MLHFSVPFLLGSASPRRKQLLEKLNLSFQTATPNCEEQIPQLSAEEIVCNLALQKNDALAPQFPQHLILTADTLVFLDDHILGKPNDAAEARQMLEQLSGKTHTVYTGICLRFKERNICTAEKTLVRFGVLNADEIEAYIATGSPLDKAGAYGIQDDFGALFIEGIEGDYFNVVGLPLHRLYQTLKSHFPDLMK